MAYKKWLISEVDKAEASTLANECDTDPFVALIAASRGYNDPSDLEQFLSYEPIFSSPYELPDMEVAVAAIRNAIDKGERIAVYGDFDCDGVTATAVLYDALKNLGADVIYYIPDRFEEGYGMSVGTIDKLSCDGVKLIVTVDNGIASIEEIDYANSVGIKTVVTDHHLPKEKLPNALAVVNPHRKDSAVSFKEISGVEVAYKLASAVSGCECEELLHKYSDLVTIGLIADIMPLVNENRDMVRQGLYYINNTSKMGIVAMLNAAGIKRGEVTASRIAYGLAPRINAAGRVDNAALAVELLLSNDFHNASALAARLEEFNTERHKTETEISKAAIEKIIENGYEYDRVIVVEGDNWHKGVVGIVASRIVEKFGKPTIVLSVDENGEVSGSGRSVGKFSLYDAIDACSEFLERFGGHSAAAGVGLRQENIESFRKAINDYAKNLEYPIPTLKIDCKLNVAALSVDLAEAIKVLVHYGMGNPVPVFGLFGMTLQRVVSLSGDKHSKLILAKNGSVSEVLAFGVHPKAVPFSEGDVIDVAVSVDVSEYMGRRSLSLTLKNWRISGLDEDKLFEEIQLYENFRVGQCNNYNPPTRDEIGGIYRDIAQKPTAEFLRQRYMKTLGYFKTMVSLDVMEELGLVRKTEDTVIRYDIVPGKRAELDNSKILRFLRGDNDGGSL